MVGPALSALKTDRPRPPPLRIAQILDSRRPPPRALSPRANARMGRHAGRRDASDVFIALGVATAAQNTARRSAARRTWLSSAHFASGFLHIWFIVRARDMDQATRRSVHLEKRTHNDIMLLPVGSAGEEVLRGRVVTLYAWLRRAAHLYPNAGWICKSDDDAYIVTADWAAQLRLLSTSFAPTEQHVLHGWVGWSMLDRSSFLPRTTLEFAPTRCDQTGCSQGVKHPNDVDCFRCNAIGPFPFVSGWLVGISRALAIAVGRSVEAKSDVRAILNLNRSWVVLEDIWLGAVVHRVGQNLTLVGAEYGNVFNGLNAGRQFANPWDRQGGAVPTSYVLHHTEVERTHRHVMATHTTPRPQLQCEGFTQPPMVPWVRKLATNYRSYLDDARADGNYCMVVDLT